MHCRPSGNQDADSDSARLGWDQASAFLSRFQVLLLLLLEQEPHLKTEVLEGQLNQYIGIWFTFIFLFLFFLMLYYFYLKNLVQGQEVKELLYLKHGPTVLTIHEIIRI